MNAMTSLIGQTVSHYKILEKLGEGGMGVVYKAEDTKLTRTVALKFLPHGLDAHEPERARFLQEARAAAILNHPNICTIHDIAEAEGQLFIVMEYVEGQTFREIVPVKRIEEAIKYGIQVAEGLQEAQAHGIVHRDVKAENIMVNTKNQVKVMDFGLAKLKGSLKLTKTSSTIGTVAYMAPEQVQGAEVDARSDIFSFGVVLYEMFSGCLPFAGEHEAAVLYSIVNEEPKNIGTLVPDLSPIVVNLIHRCLEKDPDDRYQHFDDIVADLKRSKKKTSRVLRSVAETPPVQPGDALVRGGTTQGSVVRRPAYRKPAVLLVAALGAIALLVTAVRLLSGRSLPEINPAMAVSVLQVPAIESQYPGISPDGKWLTFGGVDLSGNWDVYVMDAETGETRRLTTDSTLGMGNAGGARFSPDGSFIVYGRIRRGRAASEVCVVSALSGSVRVIADTGIAPAWSPVGDRIYYYRAALARSPGRTRWHEYWSVSPQGTDPRIEFIDSLMAGGSTYFTISISPDGNSLAFLRPMKGDYNEIFIRDLRSGAETQVTHDRKTVDEAEWLANGYILYSTNRSGNFNIWAVPADGGPAVQITKGPGPDNAMSASVAANRLVFSQRSLLSTLWIVNTDGTGHRQVYPEENIMLSHISPDGKSIALVVSHPTLNRTLMIRDLATGRQELLFPHDSLIIRALPLWSPSGKSISFIEWTAGMGFAKIIHLSAGRRIQDMGKGLIFRWYSDSSVLVLRDTSNIVGQRNFNVPMRLNIRSGMEEPAPQEWAVPVLNGTKVVVRTGNDIRLLTRQEYQKKGAIAGTIVVAQGPWFGMSDEWCYYLTPTSDALWKYSFRTLNRSKIANLPPGYAYYFWGIDYTDKVVTYSRSWLKTSIVRIDNLFLE